MCVCMYVCMYGYLCLSVSLYLSVCVCQQASEIVAASMCADEEYFLMFLRQVRASIASAGAGATIACILPITTQYP